MLLLWWINACQSILVPCQRCYLPQLLKSRTLFKSLQVCKSAKKEANLSAIHSPTLCAVTKACPPNLRHASVPVIVNGHTLDALIDSCSSDSFISESDFNRLQIPKSPSNKTVSLALTSMESTVIGSCQLTLSLNDRTYEKVKIEILQNLCSDMILGYDFQKQHQNLTFHYGGPKPDLLVPSTTQTNISAMSESDTSIKYADVKPPSLFKSLPDNIKPIAIKSRSFNKDDRTPGTP